MRQSQQKSSAFFRLLKCLRRLWQKVWTQIRLLLLEQSVLGPRCFLLYLIRQNVRQLFAADDFSRRHFQMFFLSWRFNPFKPNLSINRTVLKQTVETTIRRHVESALFTYVPQREEDARLIWVRLRAGVLSGKNYAPAPHPGP